MNLRRGSAIPARGTFAAGAALTIALLIAHAPLAPAAAARPPEILSWRHQFLPRERYEELAKSWEAYVAEHPRDARAWVEWGNALRYSGDWSAAREHYAKAFETDSNDVAAAEAWIAIQVSQMNDADDWRYYHDKLVGLEGRDSTYSRIYYTLWTTSMKLGDEAAAARCLRRVVEIGDMPRPLLDMGANMIAGAPPNAIILTNGDNDTYPPLAYQAITGARPDVTIANVSLLNAKWYIRMLKRKGVPLDIGDDAIDRLEHESGNTISAQMQRVLFDSARRAASPRPICYSVCVEESHHVVPLRLVIEGILMRTEPHRSSADTATTVEFGFERTRELMDTVYRLDGLTDPLVDWKRESSVASLAINYATVCLEGARLAAGESVRGQRVAPNAADADRFAYRAAKLFAFHGRREELDETIVWWASVAPKSPLLARARAEFSAR